MAFGSKLRVLVTAAFILLAIAFGTASVAADTPYQAGSIGNDISAPQCNDRPLAVSAFGVIGVNTGKAWTVNPCLAKQYQWASALAGAPAFYLNTLFFGALCKMEWGEPDPPLGMRFEYSLLEDPSAARFYPPPHAEASDTSAMR